MPPRPHFQGVSRSTSSRCGCCCRVLGLALAVMLWLLPRLAASDAAREHQLKGAFIHKFAKFVTWPESALPSNAPVRIGVICKKDIFANLAPSLTGQMVGSHPLTVTLVSLDDLANDPPPNILFVARDAGIETKALLAKLGNLPILLIGETPGFAAEGGCVGFVRRGDNLRFQINLAATERAHLKLSGQLALLAEIVKDAP